MEVRQFFSLPTFRTSDVGSEEWARSELEKRFSQAMHSNAELRETLDRLEHINVQLQVCSFF